MKTVLTYSFLILISAAVIFRILQHFRDSSSDRQITVITDTCYIPCSIHDTLKVRVYCFAKKDLNMSPLTMNDSSSAGDNDSIYLAEADTSYNDSMLVLKLKFLSPAPIHPDSKFIIDADYRKAEILRTEYVNSESGRSGRLNFSINIGAGYGLIHHQADIFLGAGISWSF